MDRRSPVFVNAIRVCLILAPIFSSVMSLTSDYNRHPDEIHHFEAAKYYIEHVIPPEIGDPAVRNSYSVWGVSYLNYHWIEYLLTGKFVLVLSAVGVDQLTAARLFNVALFAAIAGFFLYRSRSHDDLWIIPSVLLITPQVWYIFSYVNNDGFPLAISLIAVYLAVHPDSLFNRFLRHGETSLALQGGIVAGLVLGLLLISKTNYYALLIFLALWLVYQHPPFTRERGFEKRLIPRLAMIGMIGIAVLGLRCSLDLYVNGETNFVGLSYVNYFLGDFEKKESRLLRYQEEIAEPPFKPSVVEGNLTNTFPEMRLKDKGTTYPEIFSKWRWHETSFQSFVGVYGYMNIFAGKWYYRVMLLLYIVLGLYLAWTALSRRKTDAVVRLAILAIGVGISIFISSYLSWSYALQAQGRYLFPILPMVACFAYSMRDAVRRNLLAGFVVACFIASVYSFFFVGVRNIDSTVDPLAAIHATKASADIVISR